MNFILDDQTYYITWRHHIPTEEDYKNANSLFKIRFGTMCCISTDNKIRYPIIVGVSHLSPYDNFNRKVGRKISLQRALIARFGKEDRKQIWSQLVSHFK